MNQILKFIAIIQIALMLAYCGNSNEKKSENPSTIDESALLFDFIEKSGDIINSDQSPFLVGADEVYSNIGNYLMLDIRDTADYYAGHIDGARRVNPGNLINYLDSAVNVGSYAKVVISCTSGQTSSYYATLLRLIGYSNVYSLKFGISGWSKKIQPNKIVSNLSDKYAGIIETKINASNKTYDFPKIKTGETGEFSIIKNRVSAIMAQGFKPAHIKIDSVMQEPTKYFIVNYWQAEQYNKGHLPGSIQFEPQQSLFKDKMLKNLPTDKPILVYCLSGQTSASVVAYLRVLGYNAVSLSFGANGFMHNFTKSFNEKAFDPARDIADYPLVLGKNPSIQGSSSVNTNQQVKEEKSPTVVPVKKKEKTSGGGC